MAQRSMRLSSEVPGQRAAMPKLGRNARWAVLGLGLSALAVAPFVLTATSWKRALTAIVALLLASWWVVFWWVAGDPRRRVPEVAFVLGVLGGAVLGGVGAGLYCQLTDCSRGFDALVLLPAGAIAGGIVGGGIGYTVAHRLERGSHRLGPRRPAGG